MEHRPYANDPGLVALFGDAAVTDELRPVEVALHEWADWLRSRRPESRWSTRGLQIADYPGPPRFLELVAYLEGPVRFHLTLARRDAFYVEAEVAVDPPPSAPRWEPEWKVFEVPEARHESARDAVAALIRAVAILREESERRPATNEAWLARYERGR
jgi:hypothetical protein